MHDIHPGSAVCVWGFLKETTSKHARYHITMTPSPLEWVEAEHYPDSGHVCLNEIHRNNYEAYKQPNVTSVAYCSATASSSNMSSWRA